MIVICCVAQVLKGIFNLSSLDELYDTYVQRVDANLVVAEQLTILLGVAREVATADGVALSRGERELRCGLMEVGIEPELATAQANAIMRILGAPEEASASTVSKAGVTW